METVKVAIIGFGTIGSGVAEVLEKQKKLLTARTGRTFEIAYILDVRDFSLHPLADRFVKSIDDIVNDPSVSIVAEAIGGTSPAFDFVMKCIAAKKHVVTSNKELVATRGVEIMQAAKENGVGFLFEAAVGGTMPIVDTLQGTLLANSIERIDGILNGTTNFMLTNMFKKKLSFDEALERAQKLGYAETIDPSADIDGIDAQRKIAILASLAYGNKVSVDEVDTEGIREVSYTDIQLADLAGGTIKLIASAYGSNFGSVAAAVAPTFVEKTSHFYSVDDVFNMARIKCDFAGDIEVYGRGAGKLPTAGVLVADMIELATKQIDRPVLWTDAGPRTKEQAEESRYFVTAYSDDSALLDKLDDKVDAACKIDGAAGFFTASIVKEEAEQLKAKLTKLGLEIKLYRVLKD